MGEVTSIPLNCPACNGTGGALIIWTSDGTSLEPPPWVEEAKRAARCVTCGGTGHVYYLMTTGTEAAPQPPLQSDVLAQILDVREVSGCATCPAENTNCQLLPRRVVDDDGAPLPIAPDWCPLRKGPVTLQLAIDPATGLKEGA